MLSGQDDETFDTIMRELALAFDRPHDVERVRVFWEALKHVHIAEVKRNAASWRKNGKKFPAPRDLMPQKAAAPAPVHTSCEPPDVVARANALSTWSRAANTILFHVAYCDHRRRFVPLGEDLLGRCLHAKRDIVGMAEQDERAGDPWTVLDFNATCKHAFEQILGLVAITPDDHTEIAA